MKQQTASFLMSLRSRKFLLAVVSATVAFGNALWNWGLTPEQVWQILTPLLGYIAVEGAADIKQR